MPSEQIFEYRQIFSVWAQQEPLIKDAVHKLDLQQKKEVLESLFVFAVVWSLGAAIDSTSRIAFDGFIRKQLADKHGCPPSGGLVYDFYFNFAVSNLIF
jgi:hypothetical protein